MQYVTKFILYMPRRKVWKSGGGPGGAHCSQLVDIVQQQIESRPTHTKVGVLVIQLTLLNKNNLYLGPPRSTSRSCDFFSEIGYYIEFSNM